MITQSNLIGYDQTRQYVEAEEQKAMFGGGGKGKPTGKLPPRGRRRKK